MYRWASRERCRAASASTVAGADRGGLRRQARTDIGRAVGHRPTQIAVGIGDEKPTAAGLRNAAAALVRAAGKRTSMATNLADLDGVDSATAAQAVVEGASLAAYRYHGLKTEPVPAGLQELTLVVGQQRAPGARLGADRGSITSTAAGLARDLANTPPAHLTARMIADKAVALGAANGLGVEVFNKDQLPRWAAAGMVGVNSGSAEPPRWSASRTRRGTPRSPGAGGQGRHVRLRWHQPEAERRHARHDEDGHERRRRGAGGDDGAAGAEVPSRRSPAT